MLSKFILKKTSSDSATNDFVVVGEYVFDGSLFTIGSDAAGTIVLSESAPEQAVVIQEEEHLTLINRAEGTLLNGRNLRREAMEPLAFGDEITVGCHCIAVVPESYESYIAGNNRPASTVNTPSVEDIFVAGKDFSLAETAPLIKTKSETKLSAKQEIKSDLPTKKNARNFADILNTLRTEEDSFYFTVENGRQENRRIPLEKTEMPLGLNAKGEISGAVEQITALYAILRKDWSGIIVEAQRRGAVFVNDETVATTRRLRNGDIVSFNTLRQNDKTLPFLKLHEPSSLVALESLLENRSRGEGIKKNLNGAGNFNLNDVENSVIAEPYAPFLERRFFGHFNFFEVVSMVIGTLIGAVLIFLLLEFFVG